MELRDIGVPAGRPEILTALVAADGTAAHRWPRSLAADNRASPRDIADALHLMVMLHGRHPGLIDLAAVKGVGGPAAPWLAAAAEGFAVERAYLNRLVVAAGPLPSTQGHHETETAVLAQRHAIEMLARSDRAGCAVGAALALALDWQAVRDLLDAAAVRLGVSLARPDLPPAAETRAIAAATATGPGVERALAFGAQQVLVQHRGLWDLLESRASLRRLG